MNRTAHLLGVAVASLTCPIGAFAQDAADGVPAEVATEAEVQAATEGATDSGAIGGGDIIVTAEKRAENVQNVPAAITAIGGEALAQVGVFDQSQLSKLVPALQIGAQGGNGVAFLRGVGQTQGSPNTQPGVSINMNGVYLPRESGTTPLFDMQRVEVLPGPQGTLWGRNAAGGAINFITKRPVDDFEFSGSVEVGNFDLVHPTAAVNMPLAEGIALRAAGEYHTRDGYLSNGANDRDSYSGRLSLLLEPTDRISALLMANFTHEGGIGATSVLFSEQGIRGPFNPLGDIYNQTFPTDLLYTHRDMLTLMGEFTFGLTDEIDITYVPALVDIDSDEVVQFQGRLPSALNRTVSQYSHELRLSGVHDRFNWVLGAFAYDSEHDFQNVVSIDRPTPVGSVRFFNDLKSRAIFGQGTYSVTDAFRLTLGGRYSIDEFDGFARTATPPRSEAAPLIGEGSDRDERADYKVGFEYDLAPRSMVYGTVQTGYLVGGFLQNGGLFEPAKLTAYTLGSKNRLFDNLLTANLELFYYDYKDYQLQLVQGTNFLSVNSPARVIGGQLDLAAQPGDNDSLNLSVSVQDAQIRDRNPASSGLFIRDGVPVSIFGYELPNAPDVTITGGWTHQFDLPNEGVIESRVQSYYSSGYWMVFTHNLNTRQKAYTLTDLTLTYRPPNRLWSIGAFVRNIEDEPVFVGANAPAPNALSAPYVNAPRTYGVRFDWSI